MRGRISGAFTSERRPWITPYGQYRGVSQGPVVARALAVSLAECTAKMRVAAEAVSRSDLADAASFSWVIEGNTHSRQTLPREVARHPALWFEETVQLRP